MRILFIYPEFPDTFWSFKHALSFIQKKSSSPPLGALTISAMLPKDWDKRLVDLNVAPLLDLDIAWAEMIFVSAMVVQAKSAHLIIQRSKAAGKTVVAGGPLFTGEWEQFPEVDHFILNEGEITLPLFLADLANGNPRRVYQTEEYADIHQTPVPDWSLIDPSKYDSLGIQYSRGCPYNCDFCNVTALLGHRPRTKTAEQIVAELDEIYALGWRRNIFFVDDNFICNKKQLKEEILPALINWRKGKVGCQFITEASINLADDNVLMKMMTDAGFVSVFVGIETPDEASLLTCNKKQNTQRDLIETVHKIQKSGIQVMAGFIVGFDSDTPTIFQRQIEFIQKSGIVTAMVGMLQAPYGTQLYARMQEEGRLVKGMSGDNTDGSTNIVPRMGIDNLTEGYKRILNEIYSPKQFYTRVKTFLSLYKLPDTPAHLEIEEFKAFFRSVWQLGVIGRERAEYWKLFFWTLFKYPRKFAMAITFSIYGYHFRQVSALNGLSAD